ncbi:hypothetical protein N7507_003849 [Penicillium longicatenatum]|nr:hypothetical protein N7507_003849 [Penicillium longicatenatum]
MAYWGFAYAAGPNYNKSWLIFDPRDLDRSVKSCYEAVKKANQLAAVESITPVDRALLHAIRFRFPVDHPVSDFSTVDKAYADATKRVYSEFGSKDLDVTTLYADALMHTSIRKIFDVKSGLPNEASPVHELRTVFDKAFQQDGAESRPDEKYLAKEGGLNFYSFYRLHNYHSLIYAAMLSGRRKIVLNAVENMEKSITDDLLRVQSPPLADWMEFFKAVRDHVYIRFGMWEEIKSLQLPTDQALYCVTTTMTHYGKAIAWAATGDVETADQERELYHKAAKTVPPTRKDFPNLISDVLKVDTAMLDGELEYRRGHYDRAFESLREAIRHDDALRYTEPWGWMVPTRHAYAALMLEQGEVEEAARAYAEDLGLDKTLTRAHQHSYNVWALHGYHECLLRLGRESEALIINQRLELALAFTDVPIRSSCFCRLGVSSQNDTVACPR